MTERISNDWWQVVMSDIFHLELQAEYQLFIAVIHRALIDYLCPTTPVYIQAEVSRWLFDDQRHIMSLFYICDILSDDPDHLRERIRWAAKNSEFKLNTVIFRVDR